MDPGRRRAPLYGLRLVVYAFPKAPSLPELWWSVLRRVLERFGPAAQVRTDQGGSRLSRVLCPRGWRLSWLAQMCFRCVEVFCVFVFFLDDYFYTHTHPHDEETIIFVLL